MGIFHKRRKTDDELSALSAVNADRCEEKFSYRIAHDAGYLESEIYERLRENVPVIDACIEKIVRLVGDFRAVADDERWQDELDRFCTGVPVGISGRSIHLCRYVP